jgi:hypothetical protein
MTIATTAFRAAEWLETEGDSSTVFRGIDGDAVSSVVGPDFEVHRFQGDRFQGLDG